MESSFSKNSNTRYTLNFSSTINSLVVLNVESSTTSSSGVPILMKFARNTGASNISNVISSPDRNETDSSKVT